ncbi:MAG: leucine-rich repeat domain-containing protein [Clostridia bacterium]|nr:leucine-rich repeat domain-containing protein [Clostridia bacterium]
MKKLLTILLAALMLVSAVACSPDADNTDVEAVKPKGDQLVTTFVAETGTYTYEYIDSATICITDYVGKDEKHALAIPATMNDKAVIAIGEGAFDNLSNITAVSVPASVTEIGKMAFASCKELKSVSLPADLTALGKGAFFDCSALETVSFTAANAAKLEVISENAFQNCVKLSSINLPATVKEIGKGAFANCSALASINLPANLEKIATQAFHKCTALAAVSFPATLVSCEAYAFAECAALANVTFANAENWNVDLSTNDARVKALVENYTVSLVKGQ